MDESTRKKIEEIQMSMLRELIQENHDHPILKPVVTVCGRCKTRFWMQTRCPLYPDGIPEEVMDDMELDCKEFQPL